MSVLAVIPARLGARRLPRKPLRDVGGLPLVVRVWQRVVRTGVADTVVVATDAAEVEAACAAHQVPAVRTRGDHPSGTDRVAEVAARPAYAGARAVLNVQGDEPFVSAAALAGALAPVLAGAHPIGTVAAPDTPAILADPDVVKVVLADDGRALYFSRAAIPWLRDADDREQLAPLVHRHLGVYAYTPDALARWVALPPHPLEQVERLEQLRPLAHGLTIGVHRLAAPFAGGVDTPADLARADRLAREDAGHEAGAPAGSAPLAP